MIHGSNLLAKFLSFSELISTPPLFQPLRVLSWLLLYAFRLTGQTKFVLAVFCSSLWSVSQYLPKLLVSFTTAKDSASSKRYLVRGFRFGLTSTEV